MKYGPNKINNRLFTQQAGWLCDKAIELHSLGPKIKLHKWYSFVNDEILIEYSLLT
jgi:hypothetical protein